MSDQILSDRPVQKSSITDLTEWWLRIQGSPDGDRRYEERISLEVLRQCIGGAGGGTDGVVDDFTCDDPLAPNIATISRTNGLADITVDLSKFAVNTLIDSANVTCSAAGVLTIPYTDSTPNTVVNLSKFLDNINLMALTCAFNAATGTMDLVGALSNSTTVRLGDITGCVFSHVTQAPNDPVPAANGRLQVVCEAGTDTAMFLVMPDGTACNLAQQSDADGFNKWSFVNQANTFDVDSPPALPNVNTLPAGMQVGNNCIECWANGTRVFEITAVDPNGDGSVPYTISQTGGFKEDRESIPQVYCERPIDFTGWPVPYAIIAPNDPVDRTAGKLAGFEWDGTDLIEKEEAFVSDDPNDGTAVDTNSISDITVTGPVAGVYTFTHDPGDGTEPSVHTIDVCPDERIFDSASTSPSDAIFQATTASPKCGTYLNWTDPVSGSIYTWQSTKDGTFQLVNCEPGPPVTIPDSAFADATDPQTAEAATWISTNQPHACNGSIFETPAGSTYTTAAGAVTNIEEMITVGVSTQNTCDNTGLAANAPASTAAPANPPTTGATPIFHVESWRNAVRFYLWSGTAWSLCSQVVTQATLTAYPEKRCVIGGGNPCFGATWDASSISSAGNVGGYFLTFNIDQDYVIWCQSSAFSGDDVQNDTHTILECLLAVQNPAFTIDIPASLNVAGGILPNGVINFRICPTDPTQSVAQIDGGVWYEGGGTAAPFAGTIPAPLPAVTNDDLSFPTAGLANGLFLQNSAIDGMLPNEVLPYTRLKTDGTIDVVTLPCDAMPPAGEDVEDDSLFLEVYTGATPEDADTAMRADTDTCPEATVAQAVKGCTITGKVSGQGRIKNGDTSTYPPIPLNASDGDVYQATNEYGQVFIGPIVDNGGTLGYDPEACASPPKTQQLDICDLVALANEGYDVTGITFADTAAATDAEIQTALASFANLNPECCVFFKCAATHGDQFVGAVVDGDASTNLHGSNDGGAEVTKASLAEFVNFLPEINVKPVKVDGATGEAKIFWDVELNARGDSITNIDFEIEDANGDVFNPTGVINAASGSLTLSVSGAVVPLTLNSQVTTACGVSPARNCEVECSPADCPPYKAPDVASLNITPAFGNEVTGEPWVPGNVSVDDGIFHFATTDPDRLSAPRDLDFNWYLGTNFADASAGPNDVTGLMKFDKPVENLTFEIRDIDFVNGTSYDEITISTANGTPVNATIVNGTPTITGSGTGSAVLDASTTTGSGRLDNVVLITIPGPVQCVEIFFQILPGTQTGVASSIGIGPVNFDVECPLDKNLILDWYNSENEFDGNGFAEAFPNAVKCAGECIYTAGRTYTIKNGEVCIKNEATPRVKCVDGCIDPADLPNVDPWWCPFDPVTIVGDQSIATGMQVNAAGDAIELLTDYKETPVHIPSVFSSSICGGTTTKLPCDTQEAEPEVTSIMSETCGHAVLTNWGQSNNGGTGYDLPTSPPIPVVFDPAKQNQYVMLGYSFGEFTSARGGDVDMVQETAAELDAATTTNGTIGPWVRKCFEYHAPEIGTRYLAVYYAPILASGSFTVDWSVDGTPIQNPGSATESVGDWLFQLTYGVVQVDNAGAGGPCGDMGVAPPNSFVESGNGDNLNTATIEYAEQPNCPVLTWADPHHTVNNSGPAFTTDPKNVCGVWQGTDPVLETGFQMGGKNIITNVGGFADTLLCQTGLFVNVSPPQQVYNVIKEDNGAAGFDGAFCSAALNCKNESRYVPFGSGTHVDELELPEVCPEGHEYFVKCQVEATKIYVTLQPGASYAFASVVNNVSGPEEIVTNNTADVQQVTVDIPGRCDWVSPATGTVQCESYIGYRCINDVPGSEAFHSQYRISLEAHAS